MKKLIAVLILACFSIGFSSAAFCTEMKVSSHLETFYERSEDVGDARDNDKFKINQLYFTFDGKFDNNLYATLKIDAADFISADGKTVTEKFVEEANFTFKKIMGSPVTLVFGKDEMPFGLDYNKFLNDPLVHNFEIDKVWGLHAIIDIDQVGNFAAAVYENRNGSDGNEATDNFTCRLTVDKLIKGLLIEVSYAVEEYEPAATSEDDTRYSVGCSYNFLDGANVNLEYTGFKNLKGTEDYDPSLISVGAEYKMDIYKIFARYENVDADDKKNVEENFYMFGVSCTPSPKYTISLEWANFNTGDYKDASDLDVAEDSIESSIIFGVNAKF